MKRYLIGLLFIALMGRGALAQADLVAMTLDTVNVRTEPMGTVMTQFAPRTNVIVEGRNQRGDWVLVRSQDGAVRGWVASRYTVWDENVTLASLPILNEVIGFVPSAPVEGASAPTVPVEGGLPLSEGDEAIVARLLDVPMVPNISPNALNIYRRGVNELGRNPNYFLKVGDSNSASLAYLGFFGNGRYNLGNFGGLQRTINFFKQQGNPFTSEPITSQSGNLTTSIIDPIFTNRSYCNQGESPLQCELRYSNASVALIYLGAADNQLLDSTTYYNALRKIVEDSISSGALPILTTMPTRPHPERPQSYGLEFNRVILEVAVQFDIPVINMWAAVRELPDGGLEGDLLHFTVNPSYNFLDLRTDHLQWGYAMWNLRVLQTLEAVRIAVGG